jgi:hypothetical protein
MMKNNHLANEAWKAHRIKMQDEKEILFESKIKGTTNLTEVQEKKIFEYAWGEGHSSGDYEVEVIFIFDRLVELVEDCLKWGLLFVYFRYIII